MNVLIVDDHPIFREGLIKLIETRPELQVVGAASGIGRGLTQRRHAGDEELFEAVRD